MMKLAERIEIPPEAVRFPARHEVVAGILRLDGKEIPVVVKMAKRSFLDRFVPSMADRSLTVARALLSRGIPTPEPFGVERVGDDWWFVARRIEGAEQIRSWFLRRDDPTRADPREEPRVRIGFVPLVGLVGRLARTMHDAGVYFRDFTDGNILVSEDESGVRLWLVDLSRARLSSRPVPFWNRWRDLARPGLNRPDDLKLLLQSYFDRTEPPALALLGVRLLRARIVRWDGLKKRLRPWKRGR